jgi:GNAT superfamily N-acetyltransferase
MPCPCLPRSPGTGKGPDAQQTTGFRSDREGSAARDPVPLLAGVVSLHVIEWVHRPASLARLSAIVIDKDSSRTGVGRALIQFVEEKTSPNVGARAAYGRKGATSATNRTIRRASLPSGSRLGVVNCKALLTPTLYQDRPIVLRVVSLLA